MNPAETPQSPPRQTTRSTLNSILIGLLPLLSILYAAPPSNDNFANATQLAGTFDSSHGTNIDATLEPGEPPEHAFNSVWYKWESPGVGRARFSVLPSGTDPVVNTRVIVWYGTDLTSLKFVGMNYSYSNEVLIPNVPVITGGKYHISICSTQNFSTVPGEFDISVVLDSATDLNALSVRKIAARNWAFSRALNITDNDTTAISYVLDSSQREAGEPPQNPNHSSWYKFTAPTTGTTTISLAGSNYGYYAEWVDKSLLAYEVDSFAEMATSDPVASSTSTGGLPPDMTVQTTAGRTYYFTVGSGRWNGQSLTPVVDATSFGWHIFTLRHSETPPPPPPPPITEEEGASDSAARAAAQAAARAAQISTMNRLIKKLKSNLKKAKKSRNSSKAKKLKSKFKKLKKQLRYI